jgi:hypothetical protein
MSRRLSIGVIWLALVSALMLAVSASAQGTISYHQPSAPLAGLVGVTLDLDGNGQIDARFYSASYPPANYYATGASGAGSAELLVTPNTGPDGGSYLAALSAGFLIGGPTNTSLLWAAQDAPSSYGDANVLGAYIPEDANGSLVPVGYFYGTTAFMGIHFQAGSEWHYGWVRVRGGSAGLSDDGQFYLNPPGWILDWAYETRPDTPILVGAIPEPSAISLSLLGFLLTFARRSQTRFCP